jgi:hypothetical protein
MTKPDQNDESGPNPGSRLGRALGGLRKTSVFIPPAVDAAVLEQARPHLTRIRAERSRRQRNQWLALAACLVIVAAVAQAVLHRSTTQFAREDLNRDGRVDILDAFQLAREIKDGKVPATGDFNGDGKVDAADVGFLAKQAVSLQRGGRS